MNDIGIKIVDGPKDRLASASPVVDGGCENEVDPLSIDDVDGSQKELFAVEVKREVEDHPIAGSCDDNAKEDNVSDPLEKDLQESQDELLNEEELLKDDENSTSKLIEANIASLDLPETETKSAEEEETVKVQVKEKTPSPPPQNKSYPLREEKCKEPSPIKEVPVVPVIEPQPSSSRETRRDVVMNEMPVLGPMTEKPESNHLKPIVHSLNGDIPKEDHAVKRRASEDIETESPLKRLCQEVEKTFPQHDIMINDYIQTATKNNIEEIQRHTEQLLSEIQTLRELAQKKEHEWNNILHLKKVKEEILLRLLRRKQVLSFEKSADVNVNVNGTDKVDPFDYLNHAKNLAIDKSDEISGLSIKQAGPTMMNHMIQPPVMPVSTYNPMVGLPPPYDKAAHMQPLPKPMFPQPMLMPGPLPVFPRDMNGMPTGYGMPMGRQGPTKDVKSIIADYRQRNPEVTPRRGRRMNSKIHPNMMNIPRPIAPKMDGMNNLNNLNMLFNSLDMNQKAMLERLQQMQGGGLANGVSFKDVLVQFANMQQAQAPLLPPRPIETITSNSRPEHHMRPDSRRRPERPLEEPPKQERLASPGPRLPPPPYPEISLLPVSSAQDNGQGAQQSSLLHGILTKQACTASQSYSPTLAKLLKSPDRKQTPSLPTYGQAKNCGEITITPVQPTPPPPDPQPEKAEVVQLDDEESPGSEGSTGETGEAAASPGGSGSGSGRLVIDEGGDDTPLCQGCRRRDAQFVCAGCANQWYCSRECQVAAWDDHSDMCTG